MKHRVRRVADDVIVPSCRSHQIGVVDLSGRSMMRANPIAGLDHHTADHHLDLIGQFVALPVATVGEVPLDAHLRNTPQSADPLGDFRVLVVKMMSP